MMVQDQRKHTAIGSVRSGRRLLGRAGCFLGNHDEMVWGILVEGWVQNMKILNEARDEVGESRKKQQAEGGGKGRRGIRDL